MNDLKSLQSRLGYHFQNQKLLTHALTHRSCGKNNNDRLEYLGDSLLGFVIAEILFTRFPQASTGELTRIRARLVCNESLAVHSRSLAVQPCLLFGNSLSRNEYSEHDSILANALESIIGALYLDSDIATVQSVLAQLFAQQIAQISQTDCRDNKTRLQEYLQKQGLPLPHYQIIKKSGKPHAPTFTVACTVSNLTTPVHASGNDRRHAEQQSACKVLALLETEA